MIRPILIASFIGYLSASALAAAEIDITLFGRSVSVSKVEDQQRLTIDGREILKNYYVSIDQIEVVDGIPVVIGTSSMGGNACEGSPFIVSFPPDGNPRVDGPLDTCLGVRVEKSADALILSTAAMPNDPGQKWTWTAAAGLKELERETFVADSSKGWAQLRERTVSHPSELLDYAEIGNEIASMAGTDRGLVNDILMGVGSGAFKGDYFVGVTCSRHMCLDQEGLVIADIQNRKIYLAWKPSGQKIKVQPPVTEWPEEAKVEIREWAAKWK
ncbi:hypothetical protein GOB29_03300 [Sinorhizobium meliloti]|nr:hypothetical protein [Sinorhizobium meliloti]